VLLILLCLLPGCTPPAPKEEPTPGNVADASTIAQVKTALAREPLLKTAEINVEAREGVVQLTGVVDSRTQMDRAVEVARGVNGVKSVLNDMQLK
jgi:hyperosmotically inducible protein